ncbi:hypothetical protein NCC49_004020 [Naganishia albida]|nr:hypothetical protein NCC49_004020 [Naganishia albida]
MFSKLAIAALAGFLVSAAPTQLQKRDVSVVERCVNQNQVALTWDDGPYQFEQDIANRLQDSGSKGTFFLNGNNWDCIYNHVDEIRALHAAGHTLGSHGWSHKDMTTLSWDEIHDELWRVEEAFTRILGLKPRLFRPPYGAYNDLLLQALAVRGYTHCVIWDQDTGDGSLAPVWQSKQVYDGSGGGDIILGHSVYESTANDVVPYGIGLLKGRGLDLVSVDTCLGNQGSWPYTWVGEPQQGGWQC